MSKIAFIYPGQGAQKAGMGADFYENSAIAGKMFDKAGEVLQLDMKALCFEENDKLDVTEYTQAALVTTCLAMTQKTKGLSRISRQDSALASTARLRPQAGWTIWMPFGWCEREAS